MKLVIARFRNYLTRLKIITKMRILLIEPKPKGLKAGLILKAGAKFYLAAAAGAGGVGRIKRIAFGEN